jgi:energy-coupling factor transport system substrate-specific component
VSWQLGALVILALGLAGGFAWYERSRPDARTVALVATLAALAALGRIAFAALPNVKPSTDIILITGYALGPAPGFVVGAVTALVSNFFFGQGPWTVWQMAGWAATGVLGAALAAVTRGRIARWPLALVCLTVGFAFTAFQDFGDWVTYSDHGLVQLGAYVGQGIGFDLVHAAGCLIFALAFGPALLRSLKRFCRRLEVTWVAPGTALSAAALAASVLGAGALGLARAPAARAGATPATYLLAAQNADGGYGAAPGAGSSALYSGWAALGLAAEGVNAQDVRRGSASLLGYVSSSVASDPGSLERTILVARAAGANPYAFAGRNLVAQLESHISGSGAVSDQVNWTAFAVLALRAASAPVPGRMIGWLVAQQNADGGFGFGPAGGASDVDDTGAVLEALAGTSTARTIGRAVAFIRSAQNRDGGLPSQAGTASNAQSTAWAVQGLLAVGVDPDGLHRGGRSPLAYLRSLIGSDGHVSYARGVGTTPVWVTAEAAMALARRPLPLGPVPLSATPSASSTSASTSNPTSTSTASAPKTSSAAGPSRLRRRRALPGATPAGAREPEVWGWSRSCRWS